MFFASNNTCVKTYKENITSIFIITIIIKATEFLNPNNSLYLVLPLILMLIIIIILLIILIKITILILMLIIIISILLIIIKITTYPSFPEPAIIDLELPQR